jgi:hypothetical protein
MSRGIGIAGVAHARLRPGTYSLADQNPHCWITSTTCTGQLTLDETGTPTAPTAAGHCRLQVSFDFRITTMVEPCGAYLRYLSYDHEMSE